MLTWVVVAAVGGVAFVVALLAARRSVERSRSQAVAQLQREKEGILALARAAASAEAARLDAEARSATLELRKKAHEAAVAEEKRVAARLLEVEAQSADVTNRAAEVAQRAAQLEARTAEIKTVEATAQASKSELSTVQAEQLARLEALADETRGDAKLRLIAEWVEQAKAEAEERVRKAEQLDSDPSREAKRIMGIAMQRYEGHYLTERLLSNLPLLPGIAERVEPHLLAIEEVANIKLALAEDKSSLRLDGQDSFGREIARRAITRIGKNGLPKGGDAKKLSETLRDELEREVFDLGKRAFKELQIPRAHPDIVRLVGRLNWRTSYTQNQWKHAVEASFLCGMMASELGLDIKLARRAALMHDIGKALTHTIDGSHAVIGADYARRLGETEVVANAIGAHHTEEPFNSTYALLVAASDALSGARPGARREQTDNYVQRLDDLERIGGHFAGVERAFAVQGGRELRVYVKEGRVNDERAVELSSEIARQISDELTFPGQIKVTVIREMRVTEIAS